MPLLNDVDDATLGAHPVDRVYLETTIVWQAVPDPGAKPTVTNISQAGTLSVSWSVSTDAVMYEVRRNGQLVNQTSTRAYDDSGLEWGTNYTYTVTPVNNSGISGEESPPSDAAYISTPYVGKLTPSSRTYTNVTVSWGAVLGATQYEVYRNGYGQGKQSSRSKALSTSNDKTISIYVRPIRNSIYGGSSGTYSYYSGRKELRDSGSKSNMKFSPYKVDSWRSADAWRWLSNKAAQGNWGSYDPYRGVIYYGKYGVRSSLRSKLGSTARQTNGVCVKAEIWMYKIYGVGTHGKVTIGIQRTNSIASGGAPSGIAKVNRTSPNGGSGAWVEIGNTHGQRIGDGTYKSLMIRKDGTGNYAQFKPGSLRLKWAWNYVVDTAKSNTWSGP